MFDRLSSLAQFHRRPVLVAAVVFFVLAGALGGSVADRLDPYGADDPDTESIQADERLEAAGYRDASVIVLMRDTDPATAAGAKRIRGDRAPGRGRTRGGRHHRLPADAKH